MKRKIIYSILTILICHASFAQVNVTNTGTLYISTGTDTLYINGDFTNTSAAALTNNGKFYLKQNLINDQAAMTIGTGTLYLNGSSIQIINGGQIFKTYNLVTNNSTGIKINNDLSVSGVHTFTSGLIGTSVTPNYLVYAAGSSYTGDNDSRHVSGWVKKIGSTNFVFPVGDATYERTVAVSNLSAASDINCHYYTPTANIFKLASPLVQVKANEYWQIDEISGGTAQVTLNWDHSKVPMDNVLVADILSSLYTGGNWTSTGGAAAGNVTTTGTITSASLSSFGPFTFGYKAFPVPLKLISFTAERRSGTSFLKWITENEQSVDHFDVQRSYDGSIFSTIGNVRARNSGSRENYDLEDPSGLNGIAYYRIRSVDIDGKFSFSRIAAVTENDLLPSTFVVLNPVRDAITVLNKTGKNGSFNYRLYNAAGQLLLTGNVNMGISGGAVLPLPSQTAAGIYVLELSNDKIQFRQRILVER